MRLDELKPQWMRAPVSLGIEAVGYGSAGIRSVEVQYLNDQGKAAAEGVTNAVVTLLIDLLDDSVRQERWRFELVQVEPDQWHYSKVLTERKCWPGRGSQAFSTQMCN